MKIGIIGAGMIGGTAMRLFAQAGHEVAISNSRDPESLGGLVHGPGPRVRARTVEETARFGDLVLAAIPFGRYTTLPAAHLANKIVIDAMNFYPQRDGKIDFGGLTSSELVAQHLRGARAVKAFNSSSAAVMAEALPPTDCGSVRIGSVYSRLYMGGSECGGDYPLLTSSAFFSGRIPRTTVVAQAVAGPLLVLDLDDGHLRRGSGLGGGAAGRILSKILHDARPVPRLALVHVGFRNGRC